MTTETAVAELAPAETEVSAPAAEPAEQISQDPAPEPAPESSPEPKATEQQPKVEFSERERQLQADRDRAESQLKNVYKQVLPHVQVDQYGNILGPKQQAPDQTAIQQQRLDQLMEAALIAGDKQAFNELQNIREQNLKSEVKQELVRDFQSFTAVEKERANLRKDYPSLFNEQGLPNSQDPLFQEAERIIEERRFTQPWLAEPLNVRAAIEIAESRLLKKNLPGMQQQIKNEAQTQTRKIAGETTAIGGAGKKETSDLSVLSEEQITAFRRQGEDDAGIARIAKIVKQAQKEGGFYL